MRQKKTRQDKMRQDLEARHDGPEITAPTPIAISCNNPALSSFGIAAHNVYCLVLSIVFCVVFVFVMLELGIVDGNCGWELWMWT
jgi:hypothetical protein